MKNYNYQNHIIRLDYFIIVTFFVMIFGFLYFTGTLTSGYHFIDDHTMISISRSLDNKPFLKTAFNFVKNDLNIRFRPFFYLYYISTVKIFGLDFFKISVFVGMLAFLSFSFFYTGMRKLKYSVFTSLIFVLLIFGGPQMAVWWRLGTNETIGIFFLSLSFLFMTKCLDQNNYMMSNVLFIISFIITTFCKESFIMVVPAFIAFKIWNEKSVFEITLKESLKKNIWSFLLLVIMLVELLAIKFLIGTNKIQYAGLISSIQELIVGVNNIFLYSPIIKWFKLSGVMILIYFISLFYLSEIRKSELLKSLSIILIFPLLISIPEIFLHAKSGMNERYLLPTTFGFAFFVAGIIRSTKQTFFKALMSLFILTFIWFSFGEAKINAVKFADEGYKANLLLSTIKKHSKTGSKILLVADPVKRYEVSHSIKTYLSYYGFDALYAYPILSEYKTEFEKKLENNWSTWFKGRHMKDMKELPDLIVIFDKNQKDSFFSQTYILESDYKDILFSDSQAIYIKNSDRPKHC